MSTGWIGVDLDGTLAVYEKWAGPEHIGEPIAPMVERVRRWLTEGREVRIVTARVSHNGEEARMTEAAIARLAIRDWCVRHIGKALKIVCEKDYGMIELWDDRAVQVVNGKPVAGSRSRVSVVGGNEEP